MKGTAVRFGVWVCLLVCALAGPAAWAEDEVQQVAQNAPGFKPEMTYQNLGNGEVVNPSNGGLTVTHRSAIGLPGNMGSEVRPVRVYNSKFEPDGYQDIFCELDGSNPELLYGPLGFGWNIGLGRIHMRVDRRSDGATPPVYAAFNEYFYQDESGAEHYLFPRGSHPCNTGTLTPAAMWYVTNDGSYIRAKYYEGQWVLYFPDGSMRWAGDPAANAYVEPIPWGALGVKNSFRHGWYVSRIADRAGNETHITYKPFDATGANGTPLAGSIDQIEDSLGRRIRFQYGVSDPVTHAPFLLRAIEHLSSDQSVLRTELYSYGLHDPLKGCIWEDFPVLQKVTDPAGLETRYGYQGLGCTTVNGYGSCNWILLNAVYYPTGAVSTYEFSTYTYRTDRRWPIGGQGESGGSQTGVGVVKHTVAARPGNGGTANRLTWTWELTVPGGHYLEPAINRPPGGTSYNADVHPVITTDPLGTQEIRFFAADDSSTCPLPPGTEILTLRRRPGAPHLQKSNFPAPTSSVWAEVVSWTVKHYHWGDYSTGEPFPDEYEGDAHHCQDVKWPSANTAARFGNIRPEETTQGELDASGGTLWKKIVTQAEWNGFGSYRSTVVTGIKGTTAQAIHYSGFTYTFPEDMPSSSGVAHTYYTDLVTSTYSGAEASSGLRYRVVQFTRNSLGLVTEQRTLRNPQTSPTSVTTATNDKVLALTYTPEGNIATLDYSGGDSTQTYGFDFTWSYGMVSRMARANSPYGLGPDKAEFARAIDPDRSRITSHTDANSLVTAFGYDELDRLTQITPPGGEYGTYVVYPNDTTTVGSDTWTTSHDILFYRGPGGFVPTVADDLTGIDSGAAYQHYLFDDLGRLVKTRSLHPADSPTSAGYLTETMTSYDPLGNAFFNSLPYRLSAPPSAGALDWGLVTNDRLPNAGDAFLTPFLMNPEVPASPFGSVTTFFDGAGLTQNEGLGIYKYIAGDHEPFDRPVWAFGPDGNKTKTTYAGLDTATTLFGIKTGETVDWNAETTTWYRKDVWGRLLTVEPPLGTKARYTYNGLDQLVQVELKEDLASATPGQMRSFSYDALGRILSAQNPENGLTEYLGYDCIGNLLEAEDANGRAQGYTLQNGYDPLGRLLTTTRVSATGSTLLLENTYDFLEGEPMGASRGRLVKSLSRQDLLDNPGAESAEWFTYLTDTGRVESVAQSTTASGYLEVNNYTLAYDAYGQVTDQTFSARGRVLTNVYSHGAVVQRQVDGNAVLDALQYGVTGALETVLFDTGDSQKTELDAFKRPKGFAYLDDQQAPLWGNGSFRNAAAPYTYDGAGNIASVAASATKTDTFTYDALSRLVAAKVHRTGGEHRYTYAYDLYGNLTGRDEVVPPGFQVPNLKSYLTGSLGLDETEAAEYITATVFSATVATTGGVANNRLATVSRAQNTGLTPPPDQTMAYDANGNLVNDGKYLYQYDALNRQVAVTEVSTSSLVAEYVYLASGERVASLKYGGGVFADYTRYLREGAAVVWEKSDTVGHDKYYVYAGGRMAYTQEDWEECLIPRGMSASSLTLGTPTVTAVLGSETATAEFALPALPSDAEAVEVRLVKGNALVSSQRIERPEGGWCGQERVTFAGLPEGADYQAGLTVYAREGRAKRLPPNAYLVERMKLGLVRGKLAAWTVARFKEEGGAVAEETTTGFAALAPEGARDYTAKAKKGIEVEEVAHGQQAQEVGLPEGSTAVAVEGTDGGMTLATASLQGTLGGTRPVCTRHNIKTYYGVDHLGTVRFTKALYDGASETTTTHDYEPFGIELPGKDTCGNTHQFTGHERDAETGNDYMHFRMFASNMGRFMKPDSVFDGASANPQGFNLYSYVHGNPVNMNDPTGHQEASPSNTTTAQEAPPQQNPATNSTASTPQTTPATVATSPSTNAAPASPAGANGNAPSTVQTTPPQPAPPPTVQQRAAAPSVQTTTSGQALQAIPLQGAVNNRFKWDLKKKSGDKGGCIVQEVTVTNSRGTLVHYWEGWTVPPRSRSTMEQATYGYDDQTTGNAGQAVTKSARYYEGQSLPPSFVVTGMPPAGALPRTFTDPKMSTANATPPVVQSMTFQ